MMCYKKQETQNFLVLRSPISFSQMRNELDCKGIIFFKNNKKYNN